MRLTRPPAVAFILAVLVCPAAGQGTAPTTAQDVDTLLADARKLLDARKRVDARAAFDRALDAAKRLSLDLQQATALCGISEVLIRDTQDRAAREFALQCLAVAERLASPAAIGRANVLLNNAAELAGDWPEARLRAAKAIEAFESIGDRAGRAAATLQLLRAGNIDPAEGDRLNARAIDDARAGRSKSYEASAFHSWGDGLFSRGRYEEAYDKLQQAARLYDAMGDPVALGTVYNSLGRIYRAHGQLEEALRYQVMALELHQKAGEPLQLMQSLNAVAVVHGFLGHPKEAREFYERALEIAERSSSPRIQDFLRANIASQLSAQGEFARSAVVLQEIIARGVDSYPSVRHNQLAYALVKLGRLPEALAAAEKSLALCGNVPNDCIYGLRMRAWTRAALGDQAGGLADVTAALNRLEDIRKQLVPADFFKQQFHQTQEVAYSEAIALNLGQKQHERALETAELARSRAFVDLLASRGVGSGGSESVAGLRSAVTAPPATARDIAAAATRLGSTFLLYWVADDSVVTWVVTSDGHVRAHRVPVLRSRLDELVRATAPPTEAGNPATPSTKPAITTRGAQALSLQPLRTNPWRELYDLLVQPVRDGLPRARGALVTIVPHGPLLNLSFAALQDKSGRYFVEDYTLQYTPAASMLQLTSAADALAAGPVASSANTIPAIIGRMSDELPCRLGGWWMNDGLARRGPQESRTSRRWSHPMG